MRQGPTLAHGAEPVGISTRNTGPRRGKDPSLGGGDMDGAWTAQDGVGELDRVKGLLARRGPQALHDDELISLLAGPGQARALLRYGLRALAQEPFDALLGRGDVAWLGAARVLAAFELARRAAHGRERRPKLATPQAIADHMAPKVAGLRREEMYVLCFSPRHVLLREVLVGSGTTDSCVVDPKEVMAPAIAARAASFVLVHNHPSGDPQPSDADVALTLQLRDAARLLCLRLVDHVIIGAAGKAASLAALGIL